jgi:hypothetical protein
MNEVVAPHHLLQQLTERGSAHADAVGELAQAWHQERCADDDDDAHALWEVARVAARTAPLRLRRLRFVVITTDAPGSFAAWMLSLRAALDDAGWVEGRGPEVEVLRVANDADPVIDAAHGSVSAEAVVVHTVGVDVARRPLPLPEARPFAFRCVRERGWTPSPAAPVWSLDEDFRFETLTPSARWMFARRTGGPLLHRLDKLAGQLADDIDAIVGGNSGAAPVPALGLVLAQLKDLVVDARAETTAASLRRLASLADAYYDLAVAPARELRVPLTRAWWREDGAVDTEVDVVTRLRSGLPVTRPSLAMPLHGGQNAWRRYDDAVVAGGNTVLLSARALDGRFVHLRQADVVSRRADTTWCIDARAAGARIVRACLPLFHDRQARAKSPAEAAREAVADALGVGLYRSMLAGDESDGAIVAVADARLATLRGVLVDAQAVARRAGAGAFFGFADWLAAAHEGLVLPQGRPTRFERSARAPA